MVYLELFSFLVDCQIRRPFIVARAIPKQNYIVRVLIKEDSKILRYCNGI